jgi:hypothetical protein
VKVAVDAWVATASLTDGHLFRPVNRADRPADERLGEKVIWQMLQRYAEAIGIPEMAPHDARRTCAKLCRADGGDLEPDPDAAGPRVGSNDGTLPRYEAGSCPRSQRREQAAGLGVTLRYR